MKGYQLLILLLSFSHCFSQGSKVKTANGHIVGYLNIEKDVFIFKGIPFAEPPVGPLRWKAPQPKKDWHGVLDCSQFSASPIQNKPEPFLCWSEEFIAKPEPLSEDCLYLNVWTTHPSKKEKKPVFVWIYGGGLSSGSANCDIYDGEEMAKKGVVFVSLNYRVGVLGFMAHPELSSESGNNASGNYGFLDQIEALKWVQNNIETFGGDPNNVTIAGQSAGAHSVTALITSSLAKGLFAKAIPQSGGLLSSRIQEDLITAEKRGLKFMEKANAQSIAELRQKSAQELQALSNERDLGRFGATLDGYVLPNDLRAHYEKGLFNHVPVLAGWVTGDGALFGSATTNVEDFNSEIRQIYGANAEALINAFDVKSNEEATQAKMTLAMLNFGGIPAHRLAGYNTQASYLYQFSHVPPDKEDFPNYGAFHTSEVPYSLHTLHLWGRNWEDYDIKLENVMSSYWINFAKTGDPNGENLPIWEKYNEESGFVMEFGDEVKLKAGLFMNELHLLSKKK